MSRGKFDQSVTFQRATGTTNDDHGGEISTWAALQQGWADVVFGSGQEKRQASQEGGVQSATFLLDPTVALRSVTVRDQILYDGSAWGITNAELLERRLIRFTATRSV